MISTLENITRTIWGYRFRIPEPVFWAMAALAVLILIAGAPSNRALIATAVLLGLGLAGIAHWQRARRRCSASMVVPLFQEGGGAERRAEEAQTLIVDDLRRHLPHDLKELVQPLPVVVKSSEDAFAAKLQKRLRAMYVLHGLVASRTDGGWSVYPRVLEPGPKNVTHLDPFTRDRTPARLSFGPFVTRLEPTRGVLDEEFPLDFCRDLEAVVRGLAGMVMAWLKQHEEAVRLLDLSLAKAPNSTNHQIDSLRVARARALDELGRRDEAIDFLRARAQQPDPSAHLLRGLSHLLGLRVIAGGSTVQADHAEATEALRRAREDETDPQRDMTTYNLLSQLDRDSDEFTSLLNELLNSKSRYKRLWYVKLLCGATAWRRALDAHQAGDKNAQREHGKEAAKWYSRTLRARPRIRSIALISRRPFLKVTPIPLSPKLYANAKDGHFFAGHKLRTRYFEWRFQRIRNRMFDQGEDFLRVHDWEKAYWHFDWVAIVGRHDRKEHFAQGYAACCCWKSGLTRDGEAMWQEAAAHHPDCILVRAILVTLLEQFEDPPQVPGAEPTSLEETLELIQTKFPGWVMHETDGFLSPAEQKLYK